MKATYKNYVEESQDLRFERWESEWHWGRCWAHFSSCSSDSYVWWANEPSLYLVSTLHSKINISKVSNESDDRRNCVKHQLNLLLTSFIIICRLALKQLRKLKGQNFEVIIGLGWKTLSWWFVKLIRRAFSTSCEEVVICVCWKFWLRFQNSPKTFLRKF